MKKGNPIINTMILKTNMKRRGWPMKDKEDSLILTQIGEADFLTLTGKTNFLILIRVGKESIQVQMSIR